MVSEDKITRLHRSNVSYIAGTPKALLRRSERELTDHRDWHQVMYQRFLERLEQGIRQLESTINTGQLQDEGLANRLLDRPLEKY
jgi:hypothetical protein